MKKKVIFIDRDGTLILEPPIDYQVDSLEKLQLFPGVIRNLYQLQQSIDAEWVMITNQDGLGSENFPEDSFWQAHNRMMEIFEGEGIHFDEVFIDRTYKHENAPTRKPGTGLLGKYLQGDYDLENSWVIGDRPSDIQLAKNLGGKGILIGRSTDNQDDDYDIQDSLALATDNWDSIREFLAGYSVGRRAHIHRNTNETQISVKINLDGAGKMNINTGIGFLDHMLDQLAKHSGIDLEIVVNGDLHIDEHHTIEDTALALGRAFKEALGDKRGIERYGFFNLAMDEALAQVALDFSGRPYFVFDGEFSRERVGDLPTEMVKHFFKSFTDSSATTLNISLKGENDHHQIEACFKGFAKAVRMAIAKQAGNNEIPSTKGVL
ncbi:MAG: bifunctional histidinol-phosphatase/imidazoleglycerol-phosphate dehydratase HisB [Bacteroidia bacterium]|nr:bifunctional histidinol-phosphatase/imidazoleglycerol-phosphate dehydratase HisB [Bacteroidia bacterium]